MRQALLYGLLTFALAQATPTRKPPTPVVNRRQAQATNIPSPYPGKDSPACPGEPKYLNFFDTPADTKRVQRLHHVFCNEVSPLITAGSTATSDSDRTIYERFFAESDKDSVNDVWGKLFDFQTKQPSAIVSNLIFDNFDFNTQCGETPGATLPAGSESVPLGTYTGLDTSDNLEKIHFCQVAYEYIDLADITCNTLDSYPSIQMDSTGRYMLHEFTQSSAVGPQTHLGQPIIDQKNNDGTWAYGASRSHGLADAKQDNQPGNAVKNADNYSWMAANAFFKQKCPQGTNGNFADPPNYIRFQEGDPSNNGHGDNHGDNGCGSTTDPGCNGTPQGNDPYASSS